jgi:transglutaminase-like putative cysteine protease
VRVAVQHRSRYHYPRPALLGPQLIRLRPADHTRVRIESYQLLVEPQHRLHWLRDPHGNRVARVTFKAAQAVSELDVQVELSVNAINPIDFFIDDRARKVPFVYPDGQGRHHAI